MIRPELRAPGAVLAVLLLAAGCAARRPPAGAGAGPEILPTFASGFTARAGGGVRGRVSGLLAAGPAGSVRVEIPGPAGSLRFLLVANEEATTIALGSERLYHRGAPGEPILEALFGLGISARAASSVLRGGKADLPPGCEARSRRWRPLVPGSGSVPTRIRIECGRSRLSLRLANPAALPPPARSAAFASLPEPPGYRVAEAAEIAEALTRRTE